MDPSSSSATSDSLDGTPGSHAPGAVIETDALVIGAGPVGLFQVFELGLLEIKAHVVDALPYPGGQPMELYPDKPIFDIPAVPVCTGRELTASLMRQIAPFGATFHLGQEVTALVQQADQRFAVETSRGTRFLSKTVFIAAGVGAFQPRTLKVAGLDAFEGRQLFYHVKNPADFAGKNLVIVGGATRPSIGRSTLPPMGPIRPPVSSSSTAAMVFRPPPPVWLACASCARNRACSSW